MSQYAIEKSQYAIESLDNPALHDLSPSLYAIESLDNPAHEPSSSQYAIESLDKPAAHVDHSSYDDENRGRQQYLHQTSTSTSTNQPHQIHPQTTADHPHQIPPQTTANNTITIPHPRTQTSSEQPVSSSLSLYSVDNNNILSRRGGVSGVRVGPIVKPVLQGTLPKATMAAGTPIFSSSSKYAAYLARGDIQISSSGSRSKSVLHSRLRGTKIEFKERFSRPSKDEIACDDIMQSSNTIAQSNVLSSRPFRAESLGPAEASFASSANMHSSDMIVHSSFFDVASSASMQSRDTIVHSSEFDSSQLEAEILESSDIGLIPEHLNLSSSSCDSRV